MLSNFKMVFFWKEWLVWSCIICEVFPQRVCKANLVNSGYFLFQSFCGFSSVLRTAPISMCLRKDWVGGRVSGPWETHLHTSCDKGDYMLVKTMCCLINRPCLQCLLGLCQRVAAFDTGAVYSSWKSKDRTNCYRTCGHSLCPSEPGLATS